VYHFNDNSTISILPAHSTNKLTAVVDAFLNGIKLPFTMPKDLANGCTQGLQNTKCPLEAQQAVRYHLSAPVNAPVSNVTVTIEFSLLDETKAIISCVRVDILLIK
jgi:hypothetical protein